MRLTHLLPLAFLAIGCRQVPPAPEELDELCGYLFAYFDEEHPDALEEGLYNLDTWLLDNLEETFEGYAVTNLSDATVSALDDRERNTDAMVGAAVGTESIYTPYALGVPQLVDNQEDLFPDAHEHYERTYLTDPECFEEMSCDEAEVENYIEDDYPIIGEMIVNNHGQYRWVETEKGMAWVQRTWLNEHIDLGVDWIEIHDQYYLNVLLPYGEGTLALQSMWVEAYWDGLPISENQAQLLLISQMQNVYTQMDEYVASEGAREEPKRGCSSSGQAHGLLGLLALFGAAIAARRRR
jgi:MYXO-CTERM domain-containing protein